MYRSCPIEPGSDRQSSPQCCELPQALPRRPVYELRAKDGSARILRRTGRVLVRPGTVREIVPAGRPKASCSVRRLATKGSVELDVVDVIVPRSVHRAIIKHDRSCDVKEDHVDWPREVHLEWPRLRLAIPVEDECLGVPLRSCPWSEDWRYSARLASSSVHSASRLPCHCWRFGE